MSLGWAHGLIALVAVARLLELAWAGRNARALIVRGGRESGARHYPLFVLLHGGWLVALFLATAPDPPPRWALLVAFLLLQVLRVWVIATLGPFWTTRIITLADAAPVTAGPYRHLRHPNYLIVALEVPVLPLALGLPWITAVFGAVNALLLLYRIGVEDEARRAI